MSALPTTANSAWNSETINEFLKTAIIPMRLAVNDGSGFPRICSLWFTFDGENLLAATHETSFITKLLQKDGRCAFEIATNTEPYHGVRGQARAVLDLSEGKNVLPKLINKYISDRHPRLQKWLLSRIEQEYAICLNIEWISAWDYTSRMSADKCNH